MTHKSNHLYLNLTFSFLTETWLWFLLLIGWSMTTKQKNYNYRGASITSRSACFPISIEPWLFESPKEAAPFIVAPIKASSIVIFIMQHAKCITIGYKREIKLIILMYLTKFSPKVSIANRIHYPNLENAKMCPENVNL